jgi:hypothetical protein
MSLRPSGAKMVVVNLNVPAGQHDSAGIFVCSHFRAFNDKAMDGNIVRLDIDVGHRQGKICGWDRIYSFDNWSIGIIIGILESHQLQSFFNDQIFLICPELYTNDASYIGNVNGILDGFARAYNNITVRIGIIISDIDFFFITCSF